jgi:hypothetical protein
MSNDQWNQIAREVVAVEKNRSNSRRGESVPSKEIFQFC